LDAGISLSSQSGARPIRSPEVDSTGDLDGYFVTGAPDPIASLEMLHHRFSNPDRGTHRTTVSFDRFVDIPTLSVLVR
jgi:hypothetical protein